MMKIARIAGLLYCLTAALCGILSHAHAAVEETPVPADLTITVIPIDGSPIEGRLTSLDDQSLSLELSSREQKTWDVDDIRSLTFAPPPDPIIEKPPLVLLANGDTLCGPTTSANEDALNLNWTGTDPPQAIELPLEFVRSFVFQQPHGERDQIRLRRTWTLAEPSTDRLISTDNTHVDGQFLSVGPEAARLQTSFGEFAAPVSDMVAVIMNHDLVSRPEPPERYWLASFRDGSRLSFSTLTLSDDGHCSGRTVWETELTFPLDSLAQIQFFGDRVIPLADLSPARYEFTPFFTEEYPLVANRNVIGGRLSLRGRTFATGLGMASRSEVAYELPDDIQRFEAVVGVDDVTNGQGNVQFAVEVDGQRVYESQLLSGRSPIETVGPISLDGAKTLTLFVEFGERGNIQDIADWCDAVLIRGSNATSPSE